MRDKCGDDCLHVPSNPRKTLGNTSKYQYRMAAQLELYPGTLTLINLLPAHVTSGANFGCTSMLSGMLELMDLGLFTSSTARLIFNEDGGTENVNWTKHALCMTLIDEMNTLDEILVARLPPEHHHAWADTTISVIESSLDAPGFAGIETLPDMQAHLQHIFTESKSYGKTAVKVQFQMGNNDFTQFYDGHVDADFSRYGKPHVWLYSRNPVTGKPQAQYKNLIQDTATFTQDEWGPWEEQHVTRTQANGSIERNVRVLRSIPGGLPFMLSYPDISTDPGLEVWKEDEEWSRDTVFDSLCRRWTYSQRPVPTATSPHGPRDTWDAISAWYSSHQTIDTMPSLPFTITTAKGANFTVSGMPFNWSTMWQKLKQFNTTSGPSAAPRHQPSSPRSSSPPRASDVNDVNHHNYNNATRQTAAASELLSKRQLWNQVQLSFELSNLFWVSIPHFEGELRVGLGHISWANEHDTPRSDDVDLEVHWFQRQGYRANAVAGKTGFSWGMQPTFVASYVAQDSKKKKQSAFERETSNCQFGDLLPVRVTLTSGCIERGEGQTKPKPEQRCMAALMEYCKNGYKGPDALWRADVDS